MIADDINLGLTMLRERHDLIRLRKAYRDGNHRLAFATEQFRSTFGQLFKAFSLNLCGTVVDTLADRLQVAGFSDTGHEDGSLDAADAIWEASLMGARAGEVHAEAITAADGYVIVWPDETGMPLMYPQAAEEMWVRYDDERLGRIRFSIKAWLPIDGPHAGHPRVTLYYPDRIERYVAMKKATVIPEKAGLLRELTREEGGGVVPHAWEVVPVFHFPNNATSGHLGKSKLDSVIPLNDALNKTVLDLLVGSEAQSLPQRWIAGTLGDEIDQATGKAKGVGMRPGELLELGVTDARAGQFDAADLTQLVGVKESFCVDIALVSKMPLHLLTKTGDWPSGEALKTAEAPLVKEARDRIAAWSPVWAEAMGLALRMAQLPPDGAVRTLFDSPETKVSEQEAAATAEAKQRAGIPRKQTWREMGYSDEQIDQMEKDRAEEQAADDERTATLFDRGAAA